MRRFIFRFHDIDAQDFGRYNNDDHPQANHHVNDGQELGRYNDDSQTDDGQSSAISYIAAACDAGQVDGPLRSSAAQFSSSDQLVAHLISRPSAEF